MLGSSHPETLFGLLVEVANRDAGHCGFSKAERIPKTVINDCNEINAWFVAKQALYRQAHTVRRYFKSDGFNNLNLIIEGRSCAGVVNFGVSRIWETRLSRNLYFKSRIDANF